MDAIPPFTDESAARLRSFLGAPERSEGTMGFCELGGFLFAMGCSPRMVQPSAWLPEIFGGEEPEYETLEQARDMVQLVLSFYNGINDGIGSGSPGLPPGCSPDPRPVANLDPHSPLGAWSRGFVQGHSWLEELWADVVPEELDDELGAQLMVLSFFSGRELAESFLREAGGDQSLEAMAQSMLKVLPEAMAAYAHLGRSIDQALRELEDRPRPARRTKVGRNEPCPCGSGRKYKRCCGAH